MATFTTWQPHNDLSDSRLKSHHPSRRARVVKRVAPPFLSLETILLDMFFYPLIQTSCFFVLVIFRLRNKLCKDRNVQLSSVSHIKKRESDNKKYLSNSQAFFFLFLFTWYDPAQFRLINMLGGAAALRLITLCAYLHAVRQRSAPIKSNGILQMFGITKVTICIIYCHVGKSCTFGSPDVLLHSPCFL